MNIEWFSHRHEVAAHKQDFLSVIPNPPEDEVRFRPPYQEFKHLLQIVFNEQPVLFGKRRQAKNVDKILRKSNSFDFGAITYNYYSQNSFIEPFVYNGFITNDVPNSTHQQRKESVNQFVTQLTAFGSRIINDQSRNKIFGLVGPVGSGKSALVNHVLSSDRMQAFVKEGELIFIKVNMEKFSDATEVSNCDFYLEVASKIEYVLSSVNDNDNINFSLDKNGKKESERYLNEISSAAYQKNEFVARRRLFEFIRYSREITGRQLLIVLDNTDYLFYENDYAANVESSQKENSQSDVKISDEKSKLLLSLLEVIKGVISSNGEWKRLGLNILLVLRDDSYEVLETWTRTTDGGALTLIPPTNIYSLSPPNHRRARAILAARCKLLLNSIDDLLIYEVTRIGNITNMKLPELNQENAEKDELLFKKCVSNSKLAVEWLKKLKIIGTVSGHKIYHLKFMMEVALELTCALSDSVNTSAIKITWGAKHKNYIKKLLSLSGSGYRDIMNSYRSFSWVQNVRDDDDRTPYDDNQSELARTRMQRTPNLALMVQLLRSKTRFSESRSNFSNVFIGHTKHEHKKYLHTFPDYWLIPTLIQFIRDTPGASVNDVVNKFCGEIIRKDPSKVNIGYYNRNLFCSLLTRLQRIRGSRLIKFRKKYQDGDFFYDDLELTDRCVTFFFGGESDRIPLVTDFLYLQLAIDDFELPLPPELFSASGFEKIKLRNNGVIPIVLENSIPPFMYSADLDYSYLVSFQYREKYLKVMSHKILKVVRFLGFLKATREMESQKYGAAWNGFGIRSEGIFNTSQVVKNAIEDCHNYGRSSSLLKSKDFLENEYTTYFDHYSRILKVGYGLD